METDAAVERNDRAMRQTLMDIQADIIEFLKVDYDQVNWDIVSELAATAHNINLHIHPESRE